MSSSFQNAPSATREIKGKPGQNWVGPIVIPVRGTKTMKISGDILETKKVSSFGLEQAESFIRIQQIGTVEVVEGRLWWLLTLGIFFLGGYFSGGNLGGMLMALIGIALIVAFFLCKQKWMVVHAGSSDVKEILFYKNSTLAKEFSSNLMLLSRKLNTQPAPAAQPRDRQRNDARSRQQSSRNGRQQDSPRKNSQQPKDGRTGTFG